LSKETLRFIVAAEETIVVTTPEPTSITDAYAIIKMVNSMDFKVNFKLVVNRVTDSLEGKHTADKISLVAKQFLQLDIPTLGYVSDDLLVSKAVKRQVPFTVAYPNCQAARSIHELVNNYLSNQQNSESNTEPNPESNSGAVRGFLNKMMRLLKQ